MGSFVSFANTTAKTVSLNLGRSGGEVHQTGGVRVLTTTAIG